MQPQAVTFDTHAFVKRLTGAGMPEPQAEILAQGNPTFTNAWPPKNPSNLLSNMILRNSGPN